MRRIRELNEELSHTRRERDEDRKEAGRLQTETEDLQRELERIHEENEQLRKDLELAQRAARRQAAPFSRGNLKSHPKSPGRKPGAAYGQHHRRPIPEHVDQETQVPGPAQCPDCGGPLTVERMETQFTGNRSCGAFGYDGSTFPSVGVRSAPNAYKGDTRCKLPMHWVPPPYRLGRRR
jgi:ribosomal protein L37AE/L43A